MALAAAESYGRWRRRPRGTPLALGRLGESAIRAVVDRVLAGAEGPCWLAPGDLGTVLRAAGIVFADAEQVAPDEAVAAAERLGFPLVAKAIAPGLVHKSDVGGVILGVSALVEIVPELRELDLNPVKVLAPGKGAIVVDGRMRVGPVAPRVTSPRPGAPSSEA